MLRFGKTKIAKEEFCGAKKPKKSVMLMLIVWPSQNSLKQGTILSI